jgi:hypothetical protein
MKQTNKNKSKKKEYIDDGHTIYNMDVDGMPHRIPKNNNNIGLTRSERRAAILAALGHFLPILFGVLLCFFVTMLLIYFWLK